MPRGGRHHPEEVTHENRPSALSVGARGEKHGGDTRVSLHKQRVGRGSTARATDPRKLRACADLFPSLPPPIPVLTTALLVTRTQEPSAKFRYSLASVLSRVLSRRLARPRGAGASYQLLTWSSVKFV